MNVPSKCSYQSTCVTRTVQSIDKNKQKNAGVRRYSTLSNRVASTCCNDSSSCPLPTAGTITPSNCAFDQETQITTCNYTVNSSGGTSFQWFYISGTNPPQPFIDGPNISGSQTPTLTMSASSEEQCPTTDIYCIVSNSCGTVRINLDGVIGGCPILE